MLHNLYIYLVVSCFLKHHDIKTNGGVEVNLATFNPVLDVP